MRELDWAFAHEPNLPKDPGFCYAGTHGSHYRLMRTKSGATPNGMKKQQPTGRAVRSQPISDNIDVELLLAAAEAHPAWQVMQGGRGIERQMGNEGPNTPQELLEWFRKKGRH